MALKRSWTKAVFGVNRGPIKFKTLVADILRVVKFQLKVNKVNTFCQCFITFYQRLKQELRASKQNHENNNHASVEWILEEI